MGSVLSRTGARRVYAATEIGSGAPIAIKLGWPRRMADGRLESAEEVLARLRREADVLRQLDGAGVPHVVDLSEEPPYLVLERIDGADLEHTLSARAFSGTEIATLCAALAEILIAVHARGFLHGDVKPANVILRKTGAPVLVDFGSARALVAQGGCDADEWSLTPGYAPPEFQFANGAIGPWSDIYSLGAIAYHLIAGRPPVSAEARLRGAPMPSAGEAAGPSVSDELAALADWALELDPAARPFAAEEWRQALRQITDDRPEDADTVRARRRSRPDLRAVQAPGNSVAATRRFRARTAALGFAALAVVASTPLIGRDLYALYESRTKQDWVVDASGQGDETTIAAALNRARDGATIHIRPGTYQESLTISRPVQLVGIAEDGQQPVLASAGGPCVTLAAVARISQLTLRAGSAPDRKDAACLDVLAGPAAIEGVRIFAASGGGVLVRNGAELRIVDTSVNGGGVVVTASARMTMSGGEILDAGRSGIIARGGAALDLSGTKISGSGEAGLLLAEGAAARVAAAAISQSGTSGVEIRSGASAMITDSVIARARQAGIYILDAGSAEIDRTQVAGSGLSGLIVAASGEVKVDDSVFAENREHGVLLLELTSGRIANNQMVGNGGHGVAIERGAAVELVNNVAERNREPQTLDTRRSDGGVADRRRGGAS